jgi:hypothetical protein
VWFDDVSPEDPAFAAIQFAAVDGLMAPDAASLHFLPSDAVAGADAAAALRRVAGGTAIPDGLDSSATLQWAQLAPLGHGAEKRSGAVKRGDFAQWVVAWRMGR